MPTAAKVLVWIVGVIALVGAIAAFVMFGPPGFAERIAEPSYCATCHIMKPQYVSFQQGPHSELDSCNDCHLPNTGFVRHWVADAFVGMRDVIYWNLNIIPERIEATEMSRRWIEENCRRCHADVITDVHPPAGRRCWECHREVYHESPGAQSPLGTQKQPSAWEDER